LDYCDDAVMVWSSDAFLYRQYQCIGSVLISQISNLIALATEYQERTYFLLHKIYSFAIFL